MTHAEPVAIYETEPSWHYRERLKINSVQAHRHFPHSPIIVYETYQKKKNTASHMHQQTQSVRDNNRNNNNK